MLLIGGGEIGVEIALAALKQKNCNWKIRATIEELEAEPIKNLHRYEVLRKFLPRKDDYSASYDVPDFKSNFLFVRCRKPYENSELRRFIRNFKPDIVILEDPFLSSSDWTELYIEVEKDIKDNGRMPVFLPSPVHNISIPYEQAHSDVFLSKKNMRAFLFEVARNDLSKIAENPNDLFLGAPEDYVDIVDLQKELLTKEHGKEHKKIEAKLKESENGLIFKLDQAASGVGHFRLNCMDELTYKFLAKQLKFQEQESGAENKYFVMEKYLPLKLEVCAIIARGEEGQTLLDRIYYRKYPLNGKEKRHKGTVRLAWSLSEKGIDDGLWNDIDTIVKTVAKRLKVPFLYVEFLLDLQQIVNGKPKIYLNEITYRPDDAGFVTKLSHKNDEFSLFISSIDNLLSTNVSHDQKTVVAEPIEGYVCETLIPGKLIKWNDHLRANLNYEFPPIRTKVKGKRRTKLRLYEKTLGTDEEIRFGRIIGYLCHFFEENGKQIIRTFKKDRDIQEKIIKRLIDSLPQSEYVALEKTRAFAKYRTPWVEPDLAMTTTKLQPHISPGKVPTGWADLDALLYGGIPKNYSVIFASPQSDETAQLVKKFLELGVTSGEIALHITKEQDNLKELIERYPSSFYSFVPDAKTETLAKKNEINLQGYNLTNIDIALNRIIKSLGQTTPRRICIGVISDVLVQNDVVTTRRWLSEVLSILKENGFTVLAIINSEMHRDQDLEAITSLFEGQVTLYHKETQRGTQTFLKINRINNQEYFKQAKSVSQR